MKIIPSIASANQCNLENEIKRIGHRYENLHIDIEDGNFISNITFGIKTIKQIREITDKSFSAHLMVTNPEKYIEELSSLNCSHIFIHVEGIVYLMDLINKIKSKGIKAGIALNPISNISNYDYILEQVDSILFMTSEPDNNNQLFNKKVLDKIDLKLLNDKVELWADGGIKERHLDMLKEKKIEYVVMGREIFKSKSPEEIFEKYN